MNPRNAGALDVCSRDLIAGWFSVETGTVSLSIEGILFSLQASINRPDVAAHGFPLKSGFRLKRQKHTKIFRWLDHCLQNHHASIQLRCSVNSPLCLAERQVTHKSDIYRRVKTTKFGDELFHLLEGSKVLNYDGQAQQDDPYTALHLGLSEKLTASCCIDAYVTTTYGVFDRLGYPFQAGFLWRGCRNDGIEDYPFGKPRKVLVFKQRRVRAFDRGLYISALILNHFGHTLTEGLSSLYPLLLWKNQGFDLSKITIVIPFAFRNEIRKLAELLAIPEESFVFPEDESQFLYFKALYIPDPTMVNRRFVSPMHSSIVNAYFTLMNANEDSRPVGIRSFTGSTKVYISRSALVSPSSRNYSEEKQLEQLLQARGWAIFHPQDYSLKEQLAVYRGSQFLCGIDGSAFHALFGLKRITAKIILLTESEFLDKVSPSWNYILQFNSQGVDWLSLCCFVRKGLSLLLDQSSYQSNLILAERIDELAEFNYAEPKN